MCVNIALASDPMTDTAYSLLNLPNEAWITIFVGIGSAIIGGVITYFSQWGLQSRIEKIRIYGKFVENRIEAYEEIMGLLNIWGSVIQVPADFVFPVFSTAHLENLNLPPIYYMRSIVYQDEDTYLKFMRDWHRMTQTTHMWVDSDIMFSCRMISWYLSLMVSLTDVSFLDKAKQCKLKDKERILNDFYQRANALIFDDYHIFADPIYRAIAKKTESACLKVKKSSLREIGDFDRAEFDKLFEETKLKYFWSDLRLYLVKQFGYTEQEAEELPMYFAPGMDKL